MKIYAAFENKEDAFKFVKRASEEQLELKVVQLPWHNCPHDLLGKYVVITKEDFEDQLCTMMG